MEVPITVKRLSVIGAGTMGSSIAQVAATVGLPVTLYDLEDRFLERAFGAMKRSQERFIKAGKLTQEHADQALARIKRTTSLEEACREPDYVIEAVPELIDVKKPVYKQMDEMCPPHTILASNTSQLSITVIASATKRRDKVIGTHWFNPPVMMKLIEVVKGMETSEETLQTTLELCKRFEKEAVVCKDSQGFITTRAILALRLECVRMLEEGIATAEDIDKALRLGFNHPMGQFELADFNGIDIGYYGALALTQVYGDRFRPPQTMRNLIESGYLGRKTGKGFYDYTKVKPERG